MLHLVYDSSRIQSDGCGHHAVLHGDLIGSSTVLRLRFSAPEAEMRNGLILSLVFGVFVSAVTFPREANADPIVITGGGIIASSPNSGLDWNGFLLTGSNSSFTGVTSASTGWSSPGGLTNLNSSADLTSLIPFPLATHQVVNGTAYQAFVSGGLTFTTTPFVVPPPGAAGDEFQFSTPFTATGHIAGRATTDPSAPVLFSADLAGSGTATVRGRISDPAHPFYNTISVSYGFQPSSTSATPEPASLLLLLAGGTIALRRARSGRVR